MTSVLAVGRATGPCTDSASRWVLVVALLADRTACDPKLHLKFKADPLPDPGT